MRLSLLKTPRPNAWVPEKRRGNLLRSALLGQQPLKAWLVFFAFAVYSLLGFVLFFAMVRPWINGDTPTRFGADSDRYWTIAWALADHSHDLGFSLISFNGNLLGPVLVAYVLKYQTLVVFFNYLLLFAALKVASTIEGVRTYVFLGLLMLNVETCVSLITLNKEIFGLISAVLVAKYLFSEEHRSLYLGLALVLSLVTRWEQAAMVLVVAFLTRKNSFFAHRARLAVLTVLAGITISYSLLVRFKGNYLLAFTQYDEGANTIVKLNHLQASFGFPLVVLPKILMNLLGELTRPTYYLGPFWEQGFMDFHSQILLPLFSIALVILLMIAYAKGKLAIGRPIAFMIVIYLMGTALTPFVQPRYEYFVYVLLCLELARPEELPEKTSNRALRFSLLRTPPVSS